MALDLLVNASTLVRPDRPPANRAHDFTLDDVQLFVDRPHVFVNGRSLAERTSEGTMARFVWIYIRGHGRFVMSLFPDEKLGFQKNGMTAANALIFHDETSTEYRVECVGPVAMTEGPFNLYIAHEPNWRPYSAGDALELGSADSARSIIGKH